MEWKLNGSVASRGSRGSPEVGSRRVNDTNISRVFSFYLFALGMPVTSQLRKHDADSLRHAAIAFGGYRLGVGHICCKYSWNF